MNDVEEEGNTMYLIGRGVDELGFPDARREDVTIRVECPECHVEMDHLLMAARPDEYFVLCENPGCYREFHVEIAK